MSNEGQMKFSPNGKKLAYCASTNLEFYDFDNATGLLSNYITINSNMLMFTGCDFSPDGTKLYTAAKSFVLSHSFDELTQWNLCAGSGTAIATTKYLVDTLSLSFDSNIQLAPNGKVYISANNEMRMIHNPDALGAACNFSAQAFYQYWLNPIYCLPSFNSSFFNPYPTNPSYSVQAQTLCQTVSFSCAITNNIPGCAASGNTPNAVIWDFGDPASAATNTSSAITAKHVYASTGTYTTRAIITHNCKIDTLFRVITINSLNPSITITGRDTICQKEWLTLTAAGANTYSWSTGALTNSIQVMPQFQFTYAVVGTNTLNSCSAEKAFTANVNICENLSDASLAFQAILSPNPANQNLNVYIPAFDNKIYRVRMCNVQGQVLDEKNIHANTTESFDLSYYPPGMYFVTIMGENKRTVTKKILRVNY
jgi:hypothetical protein